MAGADQAIGFNSLDAEGNGLRVEFFREADRYAHRVLAVSAHRQSVELLRSIEGAPDEEWPQSPALQALNVDQVVHDGGPAALIGMSGRSHWSLSVERRPETGGAALWFDAACRLRSAPRDCRSSYRLASKVQSIGEDRAAVEFESPSGAFVLRLLTASDPPCGTCRVAAAANRCVVQVDLSEVHETSRTVRWGYVIQTAAGGRSHKSL